MVFKSKGIFLVLSWFHLASNKFKPRSIKNFSLLAENFSIENGLLTPTMKIKRNKVIAKYKNILENFYKKQLIQLYFDHHKCLKSNAIACLFE